MKYIFSIFVLIISINISAFAQWDILNQGLSGFTSDADFVGDTGWIAGYTTLLKSDDNGLNWYEIDLGEDVMIDKIDFISPQTGWAYGFVGPSGNNVIAFTSDGGQSWEAKYILESGYANDIYAMNEDTVFVLGGPSIISTTDGFETFTVTPVGIELAELRAIDFFDEKHGVIVGGSYGTEATSVILRTDDSGEKWEELTDQRIATISNVRFAGDSSAFFTAQDDSGKTLFCKTVDFFNSWTVQKKTDDYANYVIYPVSDDTIYSVTTSFASTQHVLIEISYNAGKNWQTLKKLPFWGIKSIHFEKSIGYVVGTVGGGGVIGQPYGPLVFRSTDNGLNWAMQLFSYPFLDMFFVDDLHGFACGGSMDIHHQAGEVLATHDGGRNWQVIESAGTEIPTIQFINKDIGFYVVSSRGQLYKTTNSGDNWFKVYENNFDVTGISLFLYDFKFTDADNGWMVGEAQEDANFATILKSDNGGQNWTYDLKIKDAGAFKDIFLFDGQNGWAVGTKGLLAKLKDGEWQQMPGISDKFLNKVYFSDVNHGWISAGFDNMWYFENYLLKTTDGAEHWQEIENFPYIIDDIFFADNETGWMVGADTALQGVILYTENAGEEWQVLAENLSGPLHSIYFNKYHGWAVGDNGLVLQSEDGVNWVEDPAQTSTSYRLFQNYPNPFNPKTIISYQLSMNSDVQLTIYNLLGQKVATLVDKKQAAGSYSVQWDATGFASGVYIYTLEIKDSSGRTSNGFRQSRKLVLLK